MQFLIHLINESNKNNNNAYFAGSYVYNKLLKNNDDFNDVDIIVNDVDKFYDQLRKHWNCKTIVARVGEYGEMSWLSTKCDQFDKKIDIIEELYFEYNMDGFKRNEELYDFQRIFYDGENFINKDNKMNMKSIISDYKNDQICYIPKNIRKKDRDRFNLKRKNLLLCLKADLYKYNIKELGKYYFYKKE